MEDAELGVSAESPTVRSVQRVEQRSRAKKIRQSLVLSFGDKYLIMVVQFIATVLVARLLSPSEFGVFAIGVAIATIGHTLRDFGIMTYLVQEKELTESSVRTAYGISLLIGSVIGLALASASGMLATYYGSESLRSVLLVLSVNFIVAPFNSVTIAMLRREMNFLALAWINVVTATVNYGIGLVLAYRGFGAIGLAWGSLSSVLVACAMSALLRPKDFRVRPSLRDWRRIIGFGVVASSGILLSQAGTYIPQLVLGRMLGIEALGIFERASSLVSIFNRLISNAVAPVAVSAFALDHRSGRQLREGFIIAIRLITAVAWPFFAFLLFMAFPITHILFGKAWDAAVPIARVLSVAGAILAIANLNWSIFQGTGQVRTHLYCQLITQPISLVLVLVGAHFSLLWTAAALIGTSIVGSFVSFYCMRRMLLTTLADVVGASMKSVGITVFSSIAPLIIVLTMKIDAEHIWMPFALSAAGSALGWYVGALLFNHPIVVEITAIYLWIGRGLSHLRAGSASAEKTAA